MSPDWTLIPDLASAQEIPADGILTRTLLDSRSFKAILFTFAERQELSEHTASVPAILHFVQGLARVTLGEDTIEARAGTWVHMPAGLKHSITTTMPVVMLLLLLKQ